MILAYQPFDIGDYIVVTGKEGKVIHIDFRYTTLENNEKIILIPNSLVFANTVSILRKNEWPSGLFYWTFPFLREISVFNFSMGQMVQLIQWERKRTAPMILCLILGSIRGGEFNSEKVMALNETVIVPVIFYFQIR